MSTGTLCVRDYCGELVRSTKSGRFTFVLSSERPVRNESILLSAWDLHDFRERGSPLLLGHAPGFLPLGRVENLRPGSTRDNRYYALVGDLAFGPGARASEARELVEAGFATAASVGYIPKESRSPTKADLDGIPGLTSGDRVITRASLIEVSLVGVGADISAQLVGARAGRELCARSIADDIMHRLEASESFGELCDEFATLGADPEGSYLAEAEANSESFDDFDEHDWREIATAYLE